MRTIALPPRLVSIMSEHLDTYTKDDPGALIFTTRTGGVMLNNVQQMLRKALDHMGRIEVRAAHDFRHTAMTLAAESGASLPELKQQLGQSTTAAAEGYLHSTQDHGRLIAQRMSELANSHDNVSPISRHKSS